MQVSPVFPEFRPIQRASGASSAALTSHAIRNPWVITSSVCGSSVTPVKAASASRARAGPISRSSSGNASGPGKWGT